MPTITVGNNTSNTYSGTIDSQIDNNNLDQNNDTSTNSAVGNTTAMRWNMTLRFTGIPSLTGATITAASIFLYREGGSGASFAVSIFRMLRNYGQTSVCWRNWTTGSAWSTQGGLNTTNDIYASNSGSTTVAATNGYKEFTNAQLVADIQAIANGTNNNYGYNIIREASSGGTTEYHLFSTANSTTDGRRPYLSITYTMGEGSSTSSNIGGTIAIIQNT